MVSKPADLCEVEVCATQGLSISHWLQRQASLTDVPVHFSEAGWGSDSTSLQHDKSVCLCKKIIQVTYLQFVLKFSYLQNEKMNYHIL